MIRKISRRFGLKLITLGTLIGVGGRKHGVAQEETEGGEKRIDHWDKTHDRVWLGGDFWANPMEDWLVADGWAECQTPAGNRSIHSLTHTIVDTDQSFTMSVRVGRKDTLSKDGGAGFRVGVRSEIDEYRSNCFAGGGIDAGIIGDELVMAGKKVKVQLPGGELDLRLLLAGTPQGEKYSLTLTATDAEGNEIGSVGRPVIAENVVGNVALVSQFKGQKNRPENGKHGYRFTDWRIGGEAFAEMPERRFGPLLWSMYSLSDSLGDEGFVLKMSALTGPMGERDSHDVELQIQKTGEWQSLGKASLDHDAWTATFRIPNWDESEETPYKLVYRESFTDGTEKIDEWSGVVKANPTDRPLRIGALTCQNDYAFPYEPVADNLVKLDPDMLYFSGDQLYENHGGFGIIRDPAEPAILCYLRKFYQFGWSFREAMRNAPTLCLPDDHDVFHGNLWGEGGAPMADKENGTSTNGGYIEPARMVNAVHKTNVAHHPDPWDSEPCKQDISVYYGEVLYGGVGFAVVADRQWKSGPGHVDTGEGRADHVEDADFDTAALDKEGLVLLGERQEKFLEEWANKWDGHSMKVLLSQTVFGNVATHHGKYDGYLKADLDSGGWPQTPRNRTIDLMRSSMALHLNGDQHLTSLVQYGVDQQRDSNWSFCTPAIAAGYPRWWRPDEIGTEHENRPAHGYDNTGEYLDGFGNKVYVYAVGNPEVGTEKNRYDKAHQKGSGFGLVTVDSKKKTYTLESFRFLVDATDGKPENQFLGWPVTIQQAENRGENVLG